MYVAGYRRPDRPPPGAQARSKRSRFITLLQTAAESRANAGRASLLAYTPARARNWACVLPPQIQRGPPSAHTKTCLEGSDAPRHDFAHALPDAARHEGCLKQERHRRLVTPRGTAQKDVTVHVPAEPADL